MCDYNVQTTEDTRSTRRADVQVIHVKLAQEHHNQKQSVIMRRFRFNTCVCQEGESITAYVTRLRVLASHCEYGDSAKELIRDRLVCGVRDDTLQCAPLFVAKLTFDKAFELALLHESAVQNTRACFATRRVPHLSISQIPLATAVEAIPTRRTVVLRTRCETTASISATAECDNSSH